MFENDESPEGGEFHAVNGRRYSVVGSKVYVDGLFGWKLVEEAGEQAEAGDHRDVNGQTYSLVGGTVYRKNWLGGWDEVADTNELAEAGDRHEVRGSIYSSVGNITYRKGLFGWDIVTNENEEADAGDIRERNNMKYSVVGDTVYRKDIFGWTVVEGDDERAEAGDHYIRHNNTYSNIGNIVYRKDLFGWTKLNSEPDEPNDSVSHPQTFRSERSTENHSDTNHDDSSSAWIAWLFYIALFIGAIWLAFAIVLPLIITNAALVLFICGVIWTNYRKVFFGASMAGVIYLLLDIHFKGLTDSLAARAIFFEKVINIGVYVNMATALVAAYLLFRKPPLSGANEFTKPNLIVLVALFVAGVGLLLVRLFLVGEVSPEMTPLLQVSTPTTAAAPVPVVTPQQVAPPTPPVAYSVDTVTQQAVNDSAIAAVQIDTNQMKSNLIGNIGNVQYTDQLFNVDEIKSFYISSRNNYATGIGFLVYLTLTNNRSEQVQMNYNFNNNSVSLAAVKLIKMDLDVAIPADQWVQFRAVVGFYMRLLDDSKMYWKAFTDGQVYETGADVGPVTLPSSNSYWVKSREEGPLMVKVEFTPVN